MYNKAIENNPIAQSLGLVNPNIKIHYKFGLSF
jgi:hypothetical protein